MSVELSNNRNDLTALAKELDIEPSLYIDGEKNIRPSRMAASYKP